MLSVDWVSFTIPGERAKGDPKLALALFEDWFPSDDDHFIIREGGFHGYKFSAWIAGGSGICAWGGKSVRDTVHVSLPSSALQFLSEGVGVQPVGLLVACVYLGFKFTRLDLAFDDRNHDKPVITYSRLFECIETGSLVTRARSYQFVSSGCPFGVPFDPIKHGWTLSMGDRSSDTYCRFYNKAVEQDQLVDGHWVRCEIELKGDRCDDFVKAWDKSGFSALFASAFLRAYVDFKTTAIDTNKSRWPSAAWWVSFLGTIDKVILTQSKRFVTVERLYTWVERQVVPALAVLDEAYLHDPLFWQALFRDGKARMSDYHKAALEADQFLKRMKEQGLRV